MKSNRHTSMEIYYTHVDGKIMHTDNTDIDGKIIHTHRRIIQTYR